MTDFVLVHGAWGGSYGFKKLRPLLQAAGHGVFTPSLTGIGERSHLTSPSVSLSTHVLDVVNCVRYEDLSDVVLLGFSYGGMVVTGALEHLSDRVQHLVYLDAFVPDDGQSIVSLTGDGLLSTQQETDLDPGAGWLIPPIAREASTPEETAWANARRSMQPVGTFTEGVRLSQPLEAFNFSLSYIKATSDPTEPPDSGFWQAAGRASSSSDWSYHEISTNHLVATNRPEELANILLSLADTRER